MNDSKDNEDSENDSLLNELDSKIENYLTETKGKPLYWLLFLMFCFCIVVGLYGLGTIRMTGLLWGKVEIRSQSEYVFLIIFFSCFLVGGGAMAVRTLRKIRSLDEQ